MFKTKYVRGRMSRNVRNSFFDDYRIRATLWGINLKPGDVFNSFDGLNHVVETTEIVWHRPNKMPLSEKTLKKRGINPSTLPTQSMKDYGRGVRGEYVSDVEIHSVDGMMHFLSETGCIVPAFTREQMRRYHYPEVFDWKELCGIIDKDGILLRQSTEEEQKMFEEVILPPLKEKYGMDDFGNLLHGENELDIIGEAPNYPPVSFYNKK